MMLSMMISDPRQSRNDIDVYLSPLVEDLRKLWEEGVVVFDAFRKKTFKMRHAQVGALHMASSRRLGSLDNPGAACTSL